MNDWFFRLLLDWFMVSDPWPLDDDAHEAVRFVLDDEAKQRGYDTWVEAYHLLKKVSA